MLNYRRSFSYQWPVMASRVKVISSTFQTGCPRLISIRHDRETMGSNYLMLGIKDRPGKGSRPPVILGNLHFYSATLSIRCTDTSVERFDRARKNETKRNRGRRSTKKRKKKKRKKTTTKWAIQKKKRIDDRRSSRGLAFALRSCFVAIDRRARQSGRASAR